jgi:hypothetical protein
MLWTLLYICLFYKFQSNIHVPTVLHVKYEVYSSFYNVHCAIADADGFVIPNLTNQDDDVTMHSVPKVTDPKPQQASSRSSLPCFSHET